MPIPYRNPLVYSLLLNGILAGNLAFHSFSHTPKSTTSSCTAPTPFAPAQSVAASATPTPPQPFHWSSLESDDYPTYIANLRKIGCPEQTIHDLIAAELDSLYSQKAAEIRAKDSANTSRSAALGSLEKEKALLLAQLLEVHGESSDLVASTQTSELPQVAASPSREREEAPQDNSEKAKFPLIFYPPLDSNFKLTDRQQAQIKILQQNFVDEIGGPNQNPDDPKYLEHWESASALANEQIGTVLGQEFLDEYQQALVARTEKESAARP